MKHFAGLMFAFVLPHLAHAGPWPTSVTGASAFDLAVTPAVYGGQAGPLCGGLDLNTPCDSCTGAGQGNCNSRRIFGPLRVKLEFDQTNGARLIVVKNGSVVPQVDPYDDGRTVTLTWDDVCRRVDDRGADCQTLAGTRSNATVTLDVFADQNANGIKDVFEEATPVTFRILSPGALTGVHEGVLDFDLHPVKGRVFVRNPLVHAAWPSLSYGARVTAVRVLATPAGGGAVVTQDLPVRTGGESLGGDVIKALKPGQGYDVRLGVVDEAGNLTHVTPARFVRP